MGNTAHKVLDAPVWILQVKELLHQGMPRYHITEIHEHGRDRLTFIGVTKQLVAREGCLFMHGYDSS
ncbi:hypothetical protein KIN20_018364 [Parelaphostrongylus tenuis]|uniref:Uncharacterized protein n=1 Tax=Parelaphostrongylus tenuis TaxID=148309 RepID=A0AAD5N7E5_PARTN|nr:hypothetical protein KIN20_018364 [Parelaphostrongylus tenuis]